VTTWQKDRPGAPEGFFEAEAAGLAWLAEATPRGGAAVVAVLDVAPGRIELERVPEQRPGQEAARAFGRALAVTHATGAAAFGAPPDGWTGPCFIGQRPLSTRPEDSWGRFWAEQRVLPYARTAVGAGNLDAAGLEVVERACSVLASGALDDDEPPARVHGDLWTGNVLWSPAGVVLIDPAAHGGHRESDLAMLELFGCPHLHEVVAGYEQEAPLAPGRAERVPLHQLHPLAVHAAGHGPAYGTALVRAAEAVLRLG